MNLKVMSFNTQHCKNYETKKIDYDKVVDLIKQTDADIIGLNEIYGKGFDKDINMGQAEYLANKLGYYYYFGMATRLWFKPYGNAIISKYPIKEVKIIKIPMPLFRRGTQYYEKRNILLAKILVNNKEVNVVVTHLGLNFDEQENGINTLLKYVPHERCILMGDFNMNYDNPLFREIDNVLDDTADLINGNIFTWPSDNPWVKCDYIFVSKDYKAIKANILNEIVSDHLPYYCEINIK